MNSDDDLLAELKAALASSRHPREEQQLADAKEAFAFYAVSEEFAALVFDSALEDEMAQASRSTDTVRALTFEAGELALDVEISTDGVVGQVSPAGRAVVEAERGDGSRTRVDTDDLGAFTLAVAGHGPVRFRVRRGDAATETGSEAALPDLVADLVTDWVNAAG